LDTADQGVGTSVGTRVRPVQQVADDDEILDRAVVQAGGEAGPPAGQCRDRAAGVREQRQFLDWRIGAGRVRDEDPVSRGRPATPSAKPTPARTEAEEFAAIGSLLRAAYGHAKPAVPMGTPRLRTDRCCANGWPRWPPRTAPCRVGVTAAWPLAAGG